MINATLTYIIGLLNNAMGWLAAFAFLIAGIMIIIGGIKYMLAGGDKDKQQEARHTVIMALVGTAVVLLAQNAIMALKNFLGA